MNTNHCAQFVGVFGSETFAFCSAQNKVLMDKLAIPASLRERDHAALVSHVRVKDVSAYAEAAGEGESLRW
jgi:hypothetical protein